MDTISSTAVFERGNRGATETWPPDAPVPPNLEPPGDRTDFIILHCYPPKAIETEWRACLSRAECPAHYDAPEYFLEPTFRESRPFAILALQGDAVAGILTGMHAGEETFCGLMSRPQACVAEDAQHDRVVESLAEGLLKEAGNEKIITVHGWARSPLQPLERYGYARRWMEGDVVLDLSLGPDALFRQFYKTRRNSIRSAIKNQLNVTIAESLDEIREYYSVYSRWRHTERKPIHHYRSLETLLERFRNKTNCRFFLARHKGRIVAGAMIRSYPGGLVEFADNSSLDEFLHLRPNDLIVWSVIQWACASGYPRFSLGGAHPFLRHFGGEIFPIYRYRLDRTFMRRHDLRERLTDAGRVIVKRFPKPLENRIRRIRGKR